MNCGVSLKPQLLRAEWDYFFGRISLSEIL